MRASPTPPVYLITEGEFAGRTGVPNPAVKARPGMLALRIKHPTWPFPTPAFVARASVKKIKHDPTRGVERALV